MKIFVKAKPRAKEERVIPPPLKLMGDADEWYAVWVKEPPAEGRANGAIARLLAAHFGVARSRVSIISGAASKRKVFEIKD